MADRDQLDQLPPIDPWRGAHDNPAVRPCRRCSSVVLDNPHDKASHEQWHAAIEGTTTDGPRMTVNKMSATMPIADSVMRQAEEDSADDRAVLERGARALADGEYQLPDLLHVEPRTQVIPQGEPFVQRESYWEAKLSTLRHELLQALRLPRTVDEDGLLRAVVELRAEHDRIYLNVEPADPALPLRYRELVELLRNHPGGGLIREPEGWQHALAIVRAHLDHRADDKRFRRQLIEILGSRFPPGEPISDQDLLFAIGMLHRTVYTLPGNWEDQIAHALEAGPDEPITAVVGVIRTWLERSGSEQSGSAGASDQPNPDPEA